MRPLLLLLPLLLGSSPALAGATPWQVVAPGARLRLVSSDTRDANGRTLVGLELDMPDTYQTYWRLPGETGIPTEFTIAGSVGVADPVIEWPYPTPQASDGFLDYVYRGATVLPVSLQAAADGGLLSASVVMGICSNICVPVHASFSLPLSFGTPDLSQSIRLKQAEALAPLPWNQQAPPFAAVRFDAADNALHLTVQNPAVDPQSLIVSTADPTVIFDAPQKSPDSQSLLLPLRGKNIAPGWMDKPVQLTFMTAMGSFEISAQVTAPRP